MPEIGQNLSHYSITGKIGKGGMGEVFRAKDQKLGRDVAIKVLPEEFARDTDRVARFQREAKLLASLNHPNIAAIYGLEEHAGTQFLVLELVEGENLADRLKQGPIPVEDSLKLALQISEALEAAHEKGVIHRDLKPANIKVTPEGKVKVLDFGLAKAFAGDREEVNLSNSPTLSDAATLQGVILGTAAYMSPEQARGKTVDKRADIWAFGCVLYEILTGRGAFGGEDVSEILASVIKGDVKLDLLPANLHPRVREAIVRCLQKDLKRRYASITDARYEIEQALADPGGVSTQPVAAVERPRKLRTILPWAAAALVLGLIVAGVAVWKLRQPEPKRVMRFTYELPEGQQFRRNQSGRISVPLAISPDGSQFVYGTTDGFYLRSVDQLDARRLQGTDSNSWVPSFSPDGQWICFFSASDHRLKKIAVNGGAPAVLCDTGLEVAGLNWQADNTIVFSDYMNGGIKRISADGGAPESLVKLTLADLTKTGVPIGPRLLPDGKSLLFTNALVQSSNASDGQITVQSLKSGERKVLTKGVWAWYLPTGHLMYVLDNKNANDIIAVPFDLEKLEITGAPVPVLEGVLTSADSISGTLVYVSPPPGAAGAKTEGQAEGTAAPGRKLVWVDRKGQETLIQTPPHIFKYPRISPDGTKVALTIATSGNQDIWTWDFVRETLTRLTFDKGDDLTSVWTPDGKRIVFFSVREEAALKSGIGGLYWKAADGTGQDEYLASEKNRFIVPYSWSKDGNEIVMAEWDLTQAQASPTTAQFDIGTLSVKGDHARKLLLKEKYMETQPRISPDGQWMAYCSDESGKQEIYVRPFPEVDKGRWQVSTSGGHSPLWSPDGREVFYLMGNTDAVMAVTVETAPVFKAGKPEVLFRGKYVGPVPDDGVPWDIHPDGKRFLMIKPPEAAAASATGEPKAAAPQPKIHIVVNWFEELKQRVPVK